MKLGEIAQKRYDAGLCIWCGEERHGMWPCPVIEAIPQTEENDDDEKHSCLSDH